MTVAYLHGSEEGHVWHDHLVVGQAVGQVRRKVVSVTSKMQRSVTIKLEHPVPPLDLVLHCVSAVLEHDLALLHLLAVDVGTDLDQVRQLQA